MRLKIIVLAAVLAIALAVTAPALAITNGTPDGNAHPYVGLVVFYNEDGTPTHRCSGSLITPTVFLTAGHCTDGTASAQVWFDEFVVAPPYPFSGGVTGATYTDPEFCIGCGGGLPGFATRDTGIVVLDQAVDVGGFAALPDEGLVDTFASKTALDLVGYGVQEQLVGGGPPVWAGLRQRFYAPSELVSGEFTHSDLFIKVALNPGGGSGGTCFGDSGGPILQAGTNVVLGVNSYVTNSNCSGVGYSSRVDTADVLSWIEGFLN